MKYPRYLLKELIELMEKPIRSKYDTIISSILLCIFFLMPYRLIGRFLIYLILSFIHRKFRNWVLKGMKKVVE